jgi:hypothetical protein
MGFSPLYIQPITCIFATEDKRNQSLKKLQFGFRIHMGRGAGDLKFSILHTSTFNPSARKSCAGSSSTARTICVKLAIAMSAYFSDRQRGPRPRTNETIDAAVWGGIYATVSALLSNGSFGYSFPETCPDGYGIIGHDNRSFELMLKAQHPHMPYPLPLQEAPDTLTILDFLEFVAASIGKPIEGSFHSFFRHYHLSFDRDEGLREYVGAVNSIFARNGVAYELTEDGQAKRILAAELQQLFATTSFHSGDGETDRLLEEARADFTSPRENLRRGTLEKLWDAFERIKTLESGQDKRAQVTALLDKAAQGKFRAMLEIEATELTRICNTFRIRHSETTQEPLTQSAQTDYLFHRMFSFLRFVLTATGRAS